MKVAKFLAALACTLALLALAGSVFAANKDKKNEYPNATRKEPKLEMSERNQKDLNKAADLVNSGKNDDAVPLIQKTLEDSHASNYAKAFAYELQGQIAADKDDDAGSIAALQKSYDMNALPNASQFQVLYNIAQIQVRAEKYADAQKTLDEWFKVTGSDKPEAHALQGNIYYRLAEACGDKAACSKPQYQKAVDEMTKAIAKAEQPSESWTQILMASYFGLDEYDQAAKTVQGEIAKDPTNKKLVNQLATIYIQGNQDQKALDVLAKAKGQGLFTTGDDYLQLAKLQGAANKYSDSAATLKEGFDKGIIKPSYDAYKLLGDVCTQSENDACAIDAYTKASPMAKDGIVDYQLGYLLFYADRSRDAKAALDRAITKGGLRQEGEAYVLRGDTENDLGEKQAAMADWQKATGFPSTRTMAEQRLKAARSGVKIQRAKKK